MTNTYLTDSDEKAIVDILKDQYELYELTNEYFKDKARNACERGYPTAASCLAKCACLGPNLKGLATVNS